MADFVLRKVDRWLEVEGFETSFAISPLDLPEVWKAAGQARYGEIAELLAEADLLPRGIKPGDVSAIRLIAEPDDIHGTVHRLWIRRKSEAQDWSPRKR